MSVPSSTNSSRIFGVNYFPDLNAPQSDAIDEEETSSPELDTRLSDFLENEIPHQQSNSSEISSQNFFPFSRYFDQFHYDNTIIDLKKPISNEDFYHWIFEREQQGSTFLAIDALEVYLTMHHAFLLEKTPRYYALFLSILARLYAKEGFYEKNLIVTEMSLKIPSMTSTTRKNLEHWHAIAEQQLKNRKHLSFDRSKWIKPPRVFFPPIYSLYPHSFSLRLMMSDELLPKIKVLRTPNQRSRALIEFLSQNPKELSQKPDRAAFLYYLLALNLKNEGKYNEAKVMAETGLKYPSKEKTQKDLQSFLDGLKKNEKSQEEIIPSNPLSLAERWKNKTFVDLLGTDQKYTQQEDWKSKEVYFATFIGHRHPDFEKNPNLGEYCYLKLAEFREQGSLYHEALKVIKLGLALKNLSQNSRNDLLNKQASLETKIAKREQDAPEVIPGERDDSQPSNKRQKLQ